MTAREKAAAAKREANRKYRKSEKGRKLTLEAYKRYCKTDKGRTARQRNK